MMAFLFKNRKRTITDRTGTVPYLVRYYLFLRERKKFPFNITLHKILKSDEPTLHDHPWSYATLILKGGYWEWIPNDTGVPVGVWRGPGHFRIRKPDDLHWLELEQDEHGKEIPCWSLFFMGPKKKEWGFLKDQKWIHNETYLAEKYKND